MPVPSSPNARLFYRAAKQRLADSEFLHGLERNTAAVYLAGYAVECILKALILSDVPRAGEHDVLQTFRGRRGHDFEWLIRQYRERGGAAIPRDLIADFSRVETWSTDIRYSPGTIHTDDARDFNQSAARILTWADGRMT